MTVDYGAGATASTADLDLNEEARRLRELRPTLRRLGVGERAAVVVVDLQVAFVNPQDAAAVAGLAATVELVGAARDHGIPVFFSAMRASDVDDFNLRLRTFADLSPFVGEHPAAEIHPDLAMGPDDTLVPKRHASSFHGTDLHEQLQRLDVDTVLVTGCTISGCVRATAVDAASHNYYTVLVEDCAFDPRPLSREAALFDLAERYADVMGLEEVLAVLPTLVAER